MRIKLIEQWKFKLQGRAVPVINVIDEDIAGRVAAIHLIASAKDRPNSVVFTWDGKGFEKDKENPPILVTDDKGLTTRYFVAKGGRAISLYSRMSAFPNLEKVIGAASQMDDISESMDLGKSIKNLAIGLFIGCGIGALFLGPMLQAVMS